MTTKTDDQERAAFEAWYVTQTTQDRDWWGWEEEHCQYGAKHSRLSWAAWQARAAVEADRQARMPSDEEIMTALREHGALTTANAVSAVRDMLSRYGSSQPAVEAVLRKILQVVQRYLPPDGLSIEDAMGQIIALVDPWPLSGQPAASAEPGETEALRDMLDDARSDLEMLRNALGVPVEPHQNLLERMLDAAKVAAPVAQEPVAFQIIQKNGLAVGPVARGEDELELLKKDPVLFDPEKDTVRPLYAAPIAAQPSVPEKTDQASEITRLRSALEHLIERADDSDEARFRTLSTSFVRDIARAALSEEQP